MTCTQIFYIMNYLIVIYTSSVDRHNNSIMLLLFTFVLCINAVTNTAILCGSYKSLQRFNVCDCITLYDGGIQADCTKSSWLQQVPSFSSYIVQHITLVNMSGTAFCHNAIQKVTGVHKASIVCLATDKGESYIRLKNVFQSQRYHNSIHIMRFILQICLKLCSVLRIHTRDSYQHRILRAHHLYLI